MPRCAGFVGAPIICAIGRQSREDTRCSAPDARAPFLLLRQKKGAKEKATPGRRPAYGGVPCATRLERGLRNSPLRGSDSARPKPRPRLRCSAPSRGFAHRSVAMAIGVGLILYVIVAAQHRSHFVLPTIALTRCWASPCGAPSNANKPGEVGEHCLSPAGASCAAARLGE